jgi:hypothetical protein
VLQGQKAPLGQNSHLATSARQRSLNSNSNGNGDFGVSRFAFYAQRTGGENRRLGRFRRGFRGFMIGRVGENWVAAEDYSGRPSARTSHQEEA